MTEGKLPKRSPYIKGEKMGRGAHFAPTFKKFVEGGGVGKYKNCVAMNMRYVHRDPPSSLYESIYIMDTVRHRSVKSARVFPTLPPLTLYKHPI